MKKLLLTAAAILATLNMYGQGSGIVNFANLSSSNDRRITLADGVTLAAGTGYHVALYWGAQGTPESGLIQAGAAANLLTGSAAGTFTGGNRTLIPLSANGAIVTLQARGWTYLGAGTPDTYEGAVAAGLAGDLRYQVGRNNPFDRKSKDPTDPFETATAIGGPVSSGGSAAWTGFSVTTVPEPSVIGLGLLGAGALLMLRRRK